MSLINSIAKDAAKGAADAAAAEAAAKTATGAASESSLSSVDEEIIGDHPPSAQPGCGRRRGGAKTRTGLGRGGHGPKQGLCYMAGSE